MTASRSSRDWLATIRKWTRRNVRFTLTLICIRAYDGQHSLHCVQLFKQNRLWFLFYENAKQQSKGKQATKFFYLFLSRCIIRSKWNQLIVKTGMVSVKQIEFSHKMYGCDCQRPLVCMLRVREMRFDFELTRVSSNTLLCPITYLVVSNKALRAKSNEKGIE